MHGNNTVFYPDRPQISGYLANYQVKHTDRNFYAIFDNVAIARFRINQATQACL